MGGNNSNEQERVPQLSAEQKMKIAQCYQNNGVNSYDHPETGFIIHRDQGVNAYEEVKYAQVSHTIGNTKQSSVKASKNDAYIVPKSISIKKSQEYSNCNVLSFNYKINVKSTVVVTFAAIPHQPDAQNPFEYETVVTPDLACKRYVCDPDVNGSENMISFNFNPTDFTHAHSMIQLSSEFFPCLIHIYAHYPSGTNRQNENFVYCSFDSQMASTRIERNVTRIDGKNYEMKTVFGMAGDEDGSTTCLVCLENPRNIILKPCSHMCI